MNSINDRVKQIRISIDKNQTEFADMLGFAQSGIAMIESGKRSVSDRHIKTICSVFNVSESWLRTGDGDMFVQDSSTLLQQLCEQYSLDDRQQALIESFLTLSNEQRSAIVDSVCQAADMVRQREQDVRSGDAADQQPTMSERERAHVLLDQELDAAEQDASASHSIARKKA